MMILSETYKKRLLELSGKRGLPGLEYTVSEDADSVDEEDGNIEIQLPELTMKKSDLIDFLKEVYGIELAKK
jgi:hypothetical protein